MVTKGNTKADTQITISDNNISYHAQINEKKMSLHETTIYTFSQIKRHKDERKSMFCKVVATNTMTRIVATNIGN